MGCSNCFNGCSEITSDQCVKYTGTTISALGITNGDSLAAVESAITTILLTILDGTGIIPTIDEGDLCDLVSAYLPESGDITLNDYLSAIIQSACALDTRLTSVEEDISDLNSEYTEGCLTVTDNTDTHEVLQAAVTYLCSLSTTVTNLIASLPATYVALADLDDLIADYLSSVDGAGLMKNRMIPYVAVPYFGSLSYFDGTGAGTGTWEDIYLCNGYNGTPDMRGRVPVGVVSAMLGNAGTLVDEVNPAAHTYNPDYSLYQTEGRNAITLTTTEMPSHTHTATPNLSLNTHYHYMVGVNGNEKVLTAAYPIKIDNSGSGADYTLKGVDTPATLGKTSASKSTIDTHTVTNANTGGGSAHDNIQPVIACYFIMYIP